MVAGERPDCGILITRKNYCEACLIRRRHDRLRGEGVDVPARPARQRKQQTTFPERDQCVITRDGRQCPRSVRMKRVCQYHYLQWWKRQKKIRAGTIREANAHTESLNHWIEFGGPHSIPLPEDTQLCIVASCQLAAKTKP